MMTNRRIGVWIVSVFLLFGSLPGLVGAGGNGGPKNGTRAYSAPMWEEGDWWKYFFHSDENITMSVSGMEITIDEETTVQTMMVNGTESVHVNGTDYDVYNVTISGHTAQKGSVSYMGYEGDYQDNSEILGYAYYRRSDLAFLKEDDHNKGKITIRIMGQTIEEDHTDDIVTVAQPPREDYRFPMSMGTNWNVQTMVTINQTTNSSGKTQSTETQMYYNYGAAVGREKSKEVAGKEMDYYPIHAAGTMSAEGKAFPVSMYNNYSAEVENSIDGLIGYGDAANPPGSGDLSVSSSSFSVSSERPRERMPLTVRCNISNEGDGKVVGIRVKTELDGKKFGEEQMISYIEPGEDHMLEWDLNNLSKGQHDLKVVLDPDDFIKEQVEYNNEATFSFEVFENRAPAVVNGTPLFNSMIINPNTNIRFRVNVSDPDGDEVFYAWYVNDEEIDGENGNDLDKDFAGAEEGEKYEIKVVATDEYGTNVSHKWIVTINSAPKITGHTPTGPTVYVNETEQAQFHITFENYGVQNVVFHWYVNGVLAEDERSSYFTFVTSNIGNGSSEFSPYEIKVVVEDGLNLSDEFVWRLEVHDRNLPPEIRGGMAGGREGDEVGINETESLVLNVSAAEPDGDPLTYTWFADGEVLEVTTEGEFRFDTDQDTVEHEKGIVVRTVLLRVVVSDGDLNVSYEWKIKVTDINRVPEIGIPDDVIKGLEGIREGEKGNVSAVGTDPDGDPISYQWFLDGEPLIVGSNFTHSFEFGDHTLKVVATDGYGGKVQQTFNLSVLAGETGEDGEDGPGDGEEEGRTSGGGGGTWLRIVLVVATVLLIGGVAVFLLLRKGKGEVKFKAELGKFEGDDVFKCPDCNEKADEELGYCIDCGATFK